MRGQGSNVIDLNARREHPIRVAPHPAAQSMRTQLDWMTRIMIERIREMVHDLTVAVVNGDAQDPEGALRVARQLDATVNDISARLETLPATCIAFPRATTSGRRPR